MAETNDRVMAMVEKELKADPNISNADLRKKAERLDPSIASLGARAFNARYPLQVKRRGKPRKARKGTKRAARKAGRKAGGAKARGRGTAKGAKKGRGPGRPRTSATRGASNGERGRVRAALLDFARDLASADGAGLVDVIAGVDGYVDRVMKATSRGR